MGNQPTSADEHRELYKQHRHSADKLRMRIDEGLLNGVDTLLHAKLTSEYHDELTAAAMHLTLAAILEGVTD